MKRLRSSRSDPDRTGRAPVLLLVLPLLVLPAALALALVPDLRLRVPGTAVLVVTLLLVVRRCAIESERAEQRAVALGLRLSAAEAEQREARARLHEINATVAGIASAQRLIDEGGAVDRITHLTSMMRAEVERLQRLVAGRTQRRTRSVDLDDIVGQIVLSHLARGRIVLWEPSGLRALGRADDIAEVVNVLLENAAVHGGPDAVTVRVSRHLDGPGVVIAVTDQGPGVDPEVRERVFDWGVSGPGSPGQGIGLHAAADIALGLGGRLELVPTTTGACFALHLTASRQEVSVGDPVARAR
jgi:signal transduction histidine kinase